MVMTVKSALQRDLDRFFKSVSGGDFSIREVTKSAFSQARAKISPDAFVELSDELMGTFYTQAPYLTFDQMRLLALDGSKLALPNHPSVVEEFGVSGYGPNADSMRSQAQCSFLYDVLNLTVLDAELGPLSDGEKTLMKRQFGKMWKGDLLLVDRSYPSIWLFFLLAAKGVHFCARMKDAWWLVVKDFAESGEKERLVRLKLPKKDWEALKDYPEFRDKELVVRLVCVELESGEKEYLCTSLTDMERYLHGIFIHLYHMRWGVEEAFKLFKARVEVQEFTGKTAIAVRQDFHAKVFAMNLCAVLAFPVEEQLRKEGKGERKHERKVNRTSALALISESVVAIFIKGMAKKAVKAFDKIIYKTTEIIRPGRKNPRKHRKKPPSAMNYKRL
jgi:Transposase DDE domain